METEGSCFEEHFGVLIARTPPEQFQEVVVGFAQIWCRLIYLVAFSCMLSTGNEQVAAANYYTLAAAKD